MSELLDDVSDEIDIITNDTRKVDDILDDGQKLLNELQDDADALSRDARIALYAVAGILALSFIVCAVACCLRRKPPKSTVDRLL